MITPIQHGICETHFGTHYFVLFESKGKLRLAQSVLPLSRKGVVDLSTRALKPHLELIEKLGTREMALVHSVQSPVKDAVVKTLQSVDYDGLTVNRVTKDGDELGWFVALIDTDIDAGKPLCCVPLFAPGTKPEAKAKWEKVCSAFNKKLTS